MRVFDCFTFFNEFELLKLRCEELRMIDVQHILIEAEYTHTGDKKPLYYQYNKQDYFGYDIYHAVQENMPNTGNAWDNEGAQRDKIYDCLVKLRAKDDDIVIISDLDEIPRWQAVQFYEPRMGVASLQMDKYSCYINLLEGIQNWGIAKITTWGHLKNTTPNKLRNGGSDFTIYYGGWHMSFLGGVSKMKEKLFAYAHTETVTAKLLESLQYKFDNGQSLWGDDFWQFVKIDKSFPQYLQDNQEEFSHLIG